MSEFDVKPQTEKRKGFVVYNDMWEAKFPSMASKMVFMTLWKFANRESNTAYPSVQTLAKESECSDRTVQRALKELEDIGYITRQMRKSTTLYTVMDQLFISSGDKLTGVRGDNMTGLDEETGDKLTGLNFSGDNMTPKPRQYDTQAPTNWRGKGDKLTPEHNHLTELNNITNEHASSQQAATEEYKINPFTEWQRMIGTQFNSFQTEKMSQWREIMTDDLIIHAIEKAARGERNKAFKYVETCCNAWEELQIKTIEEAKREKEIRKQRTQQQRFQSKQPQPSKKASSTNELTPEQREQAMELLRSLEAQGL